jgi:RPA family protein
MVDSFKRHPAVKIWIASLLTSKSMKDEGEFGSTFFVVGNRKVARVNLIASIISVYKNEDGSYASADIDDGSGLIRLKSWREDVKNLVGLNVGDLVMVIGRPREYAEEIYVSPEIVKRLDNPLWSKLRKLELTRSLGEPISVTTILKTENGGNNLETTKESFVEEVVDNTESDNDRQKVLNLIEKSGEMSIDMIKQSLKLSSLDTVIKSLVMDGEVYQNRPGYLKIV